VYKEVVKAYEQKNIADTIKKEYPDGGELPAWNLKL
ncbi:MAG: MetQ/NlpA family ABC transporter substrate-binding protein, partial [Lactococcus lactis]|nr:MetQ/NlpA family ABC transporter substrate-binding protein [Lactococcus lactis]